MTARDSSRQSNDGSADRYVVRPPNSDTDEGGSTGDDWPARASASIVGYVGQVRDKTTGPALVASRTAVYAAAIALIAFVLLILLLLLIFRLVVVASGELLPFVEPNESWLAHYALGGIFLLAGVFLWRKKDR